MKHPFAHILQAVIDMKTIQECWAGTSWVDIPADDVLNTITRLSNKPANLGSKHLRVKPDTIKIGKYDVVRPMSYTPAKGTAYCYVYGGEAIKTAWDGFASEQKLLAAGMCWLEREDAELAAKALTELLTGGRDE